MPSWKNAHPSGTNTDKSEFPVFFVSKISRGSAERAGAAPPRTCPHTLAQLTLVHLNASAPDASALGTGALYTPSCHPAMAT